MPDASQPAPSRRTFAQRFTSWQEGPFVQGVLGYYRKHERYTPPLFFFGGVIWDILTLRRIDALFDNLLLLSYLLILGVLIVVATLVAFQATTHPLLLKHEHWYPAAMQFFMGALFSAYVVYYTQSASFTGDTLFLLLLVGLLVANEFIHRRLLDLYFLLALYYLVVACFLTFFLPVLTKSMGYMHFLLASLSSVAVVGAMVLYFRQAGVFSSRREWAVALLIPALLMGTLNLFYVQNWIPPVPLSMRKGGVYHRVVNRGEVFDLWHQPTPWYKPWQSTADPFQYAPGDTVFCFTAIFAPTALETQIYHQWQFFDPQRQQWVDTDRISYRVLGGRERGFRGYTFKRNIQPGRWNVDVNTADGLTIGRVRFVVEAVDTSVTDLIRNRYD